MPVFSLYFDGSHTSGHSLEREVLIDRTCYFSVGFSITGELLSKVKCLTVALLFLGGYAAALLGVKPACLITEE